VPEEEHNMRYYLRPANFTKIASNNMAVFGSFTLFCYVGHFLLIVIGINDFCDGDRFLACGGAKYDGEPAS
jgi:hypothetical protein